MVQVIIPETIPLVTLAVDGGSMVAGDGIVYSTDPRCWLDLSGKRYVVKGPDLNIVVAEAVAYELAHAIGLSTPKYSLAKIPGHTDVYFASHLLINCTRDISPWLASPTSQLVDAISEMIAFDIWIANEDRNLWGLLADHNEGKMHLRVIDFEKSAALRGPAPIVVTGMLDPKKLKPRNALYTMCMRARVTPNGRARKISSLSDVMIANCVERVRARIPKFDWGDNIVLCLSRRRDKIDQLIKEVWQ